MGQLHMSGLRLSSRSEQRSLINQDWSIVDLRAEPQSASVLKTVKPIAPEMLRLPPLNRNSISKKLAQTRNFFARSATSP